MNIRGRELIVGQFLRLHPSELITTQGSRRPFHPVTLKQVKGDGLGLIVVIDLKQVLYSLHLHGQFFPEFAFNAGFQALSGFLLASWELPVPGKVAARRPPCDQDISVLPDQTRSHMKMMFRHCYYRTYLPKENIHHRDTEDTEKIFCLSGDTDKQK